MLWDALSLCLLLLQALIVEAQIFQQPQPQPQPGAGVGQQSSVMTSFHGNNLIDTSGTVTATATATATQAATTSSMVGMTANQRLDAETGSSVAAIESANGVFSPVSSSSSSSSSSNGGVSGAQNNDGGLQNNGDIVQQQGNIGGVQNNDGNSNYAVPATNPNPNPNQSQTEILIKQWKSKTSMKELVHVTLHQDQYGLRVNIDIG